MLRNHSGDAQLRLLETPEVANALRDAFCATDAELKASGVLDNNSGSTAVVALLTPESIWLAWAGEHEVSDYFLHFEVGW